MKEQLKKILTVALEEKFPEVINIILISNEFIPNEFDCMVNMKYDDYLKIDPIEINTLIKDYAKYMGCKIKTVSFY